MPSLRSCSDEPPSYRWGNRGSEKWNAFPKILQPKTSGLPVLKGFKPWQVDWGQHQSQELGSGVRIPASLVVWTSLNLSFPLHQMGFPGALPQRRVGWVWFGAFPGAFGLGRAQPQLRGTSPWAGLPSSLQGTDHSSKPASHLGKVTRRGLPASFPGATKPQIWRA